MKAVVEDNETPEFVRVAPPAEYADPDVYAVPEEFVISFEVENAVVLAHNVAELVYSAILKVPLLAVLSPPNAIIQTASVVPEPPFVVVL